MKHLHVDYRNLHATAPVFQICCLQRAAGFPNTGIPEITSIGFPGNGILETPNGKIWMQQDPDGLGVQFVFIETELLQFIKREEVRQ
jgi:hypothetical protein